MAKKIKSKKGKIKCRFCGRYKRAEKIDTHECGGKSEAKGAWRNWKESNPDLAIKFPNFKAYDKALLDGDISDPFNSYGPTDYGEAPVNEPAMDSQQSGEPDFIDMGANVQDPSLEPGTPDQGDNDQHASTAGAVSREIGLINTGQAKAPAQGHQESALDIQGEKPSMSETLKEGAGAIMEGAIDTLRFTHKNRAWMFFVQLQHSVKMWAFNADERNAKFDLTKRDKKLISESYQATFGDSPLLNLKIEGSGEWANHAIVADWEVYGDFYLANAFGALDRGKMIYAKIQERKKKKEQEQIDANIAAGATQ